MESTRCASPVVDGPTKEKEGSTEVAKEEDTRTKKKPTGYDFYRQVLGSPRYVVAPMVDGSELAWRMLSRYYGAELCYTPMMHAGLFADARQSKYRAEQMDLAAGEEGHPSLDRPLIVQFCANDPHTLLAAANLVLNPPPSNHHDNPHASSPQNWVVDAVDLNLGCPQGIAKKGKYGAFLMDHQDLISQLISHLDRHLPIPVTAKYRRFDTAEKTESYTERLIDSGAQMLSIHGRTREQKGQFTGLADWEMMRGAISRSHTHERPILGNGNTLVAHDVTRLLEETGADGAMVAEGNLYNPAIFAPLNEDAMVRYRAGLPERFKAALDQVDDQYADPAGLLGTPESLREFPLSSKVAAQYLAICRTLQTRTASSAIKGHLYKLFRAVFDTGRYDDVRDALAAVSWNPSTSTSTPADTEAPRCASPPAHGNNNNNKRDRAAYEGLLDRFQQVVDRVKHRLEDDRRSGLLNEHQIDMGLEREEGESTPAFLKRLLVPYSRCQPYVRTLQNAGSHTQSAGVVDGGDAGVDSQDGQGGLVGCANALGCVNSGAGRCHWGLCKRCCSARMAASGVSDGQQCELHLRRAQLERAKRTAKSEQRKLKRRRASSSSGE